MRLRPLTEAECYARCYGGHASERVTVVSLPARGTFLAKPYAMQALIDLVRCKLHAARSADMRRY